jgi:peptide/nickel transport system substrate-binding protein
MFSRASKLRFRRKFRMSQRQVLTLGEQTEDHFDRHFLRRLESLLPVQRFVFSWVLLIVILILGVGAQTLSLNNLYQEFRPTPGGTYVEGVVGEFTNANPLYATNAVDATVAKLVFAGLLTHNDKNQLVGDLAESWSSDDRGRVYTIKLRENLRWHDGKPLTSEDVVFTYETIKNADAQSPLRSGWQGVEVKAVDNRTVEFTLPNSLASFAYGLTNGIVPKHILSDVPSADLRSTTFNTTQPIGSGPFKWQAIEVSGASLSNRRVSVALTKSSSYHLGEPKLDNFTVRAFRDTKQMISSYEKRELNGMAGLTAMPEGLRTEATLYAFPQSAAIMTFFKTNQGVLKDKEVRQALVRSADTTAIRKALGFPVKTVDGPILRGQVGYDASIVQFGTDIEAARNQLTKAGWVLDDGKELREKEGVPLEFTIYGESGSETRIVTRMLQDQWKKVGVKANVELQEARDFQITLSQHSYDALVRGVAIGLDPDVFPCWHSSQAKGRLNFSEYSSSKADVSLESARTRIDTKLRTEKYKPFLEAWREDAPALGLYQPRSVYVTKGKISGLNLHEINSSVDRLADVHEWMIRRAKTTVD